MKLSFVFLCVLLLQISAEGFNQEIKLSMQMEDVPVKEVFKEIENMTNYRFVFNDDIITHLKQVSIDARNKEIGTILNEILEGSGIEYRVLDDKLIVLAPSSHLIKQGTKVTGTITDANGTPLPGVNIVEVGTTNGAVTDMDGNYSITVSSEDAVLRLSFVGYLTEEIEVGGQTNINVTLVEDIQALDEVVVIGYGTQKKSDLTGAVGSLEGDLLAERKSTQISQALQGAMPGVMVTRDNGEPGSAATIRIRGITTIGESDPLVIVDGVPVENLNDVNPNDVDNISVLKDAASASIYGARAAAGVILVTTKRAKSGELRLSYNAEYGVEKANAYPEFFNVTRFMEATNEQIWNDNNNEGTEYPRYEKDVIDNYGTLHQENPDLYPDTDWYDLTLNEYAPRTTHSLGLAAGTEAIKTKVSLVYDNINGFYDKNKFERISARINNDVIINKVLSATVDFNFKRAVTDDAAYDYDLWRYLYISPPVYPALWSDGRIASGKQGGNIYGSVKYGGTRNNKNNLIGGKVSLDVKPLSGLKLSAVVSPNYYFEKGKRFMKAVPYYDAEDPTLLLGTLSHSSTTNLNENRNDNYNVTTQFLANYSNSFDVHNIDVLAGYEYYYAYYERLRASRDQYDLNSFPYLNLGPLEFRDNEGNAWENAYRSFFGRFMYNYMSKYLIQANIRFDASSRFHEDYRWGSFPSFSLGWVVSEESFMESLNFLSFLKLRGSWGSLGNERIGNYPYQATIGFNNALFYQGNNVIAAQTAAQSAYAIENISWETTESYNIGLDANFLDNRLRFTGDYFQKETKDMLLALEIPDFMGFENPDQNTGVMETTGWEANISWNNSVGELGYSVSFNISDFESVMGNLGGTEFLGDKIKIEGSEFDEWYGYRTDGLFQTQEEVENSAVLNNKTSPGDVKYVDISGPDGVPDGIISPEYDRVLLGGSLPRMMYGGNVRLDYKGFDFSVVIQGVGKQNARLTRYMVMPFREGWGNVPAILENNYWSRYNSNEKNENVKYPRLTRAAQGNNYSMSDYWLFNGRYIRLKNLTLGYRLPQTLTQKINMKGIRIYVSVSDFFTLNKYPEGWDPEVRESDYPMTTTAIAGLSVDF